MPIIRSSKTTSSNYICLHTSFFSNTTNEFDKSIGLNGGARIPSKLILDLFIVKDDNDENKAKN